MARTANRRMKSEEQLLNKESINSFQTAIYARISRDKKEKPSDSIENQIALCESFIQKSEDFSLAGIYKDIAKTGTDFERPDFENLMDEVRMGKVNCIVVKDLSRFGRNYTELGNFIEKIFPFLGVRFVAVNDNLDTFHMDDPNKSLEVILKNIVNETYATDISKKISSSHQMRIKQGGFICGAAPYGYVARKDEDGIRRLYPDENTAPIVKEIFDAYLKGLSTPDISKLLLEKRVYIATDYRKFGKAVSDGDEPIRIWQPTTILQVLKNRAYTGTLIQGRNQKHLYEGKPRERLDEEYWTVTENAHEAIISMDTFEKVQEKISEKSAPIKRSRKENAAAEDDTVFRGMVYCNLCQKRMSVHRQLSGKRTVFYFSCNRFGEYKAEKCGTSITELTLQNTVKAAFDTILLNNKKSYKAYLDGYADRKREAEQQKEKELTEIGRRISGLSRLQSEYYEKYVLGDWRKEDFEREKEHLYQKKKELESLKEKQIAIFEEEKRRLEEKHKYLKVLFKGKSKKWDKEFVRTIIDKIFIGKDHTVEIQFNFEETPVITEKLGRKDGSLMKKIMLLCMALILLLSLFSCSKDEILDNYNSVLQTAGDIQLIGNASLVGKREYGIDHYTGSYKADYNKFSGEEILFGGTSIEREAGKKITLSCDLEIKEGVAQLLLISGSDKPQILHEVSGTYEEIITLPDGSNYIQIYGQDFTGNIILNIE